MSELRECPGCGGADTRVIGGPGTAGGPKYWAGCNHCRWRTWGDTEAEAIAAWNRRPHPAPVAIVGWIHEDELPKDYPYDAMFPHSKVDLVRMFPVYVPTEPQPGAPVVVIVPEELGSGVRGLEYDYASGWNECRAETLRLNPQPGAVVNVSDVEAAIQRDIDDHGVAEIRQAEFDALRTLTNTDKGAGE